MKVKIGKLYVKIFKMKKIIMKRVIMDNIILILINQWIVVKNILLNV